VPRKRNDNFLIFTRPTVSCISITARLLKMEFAPNGFSYQSRSDRTVVPATTRTFPVRPFTARTPLPFILAVITIPFVNVICSRLWRARVVKSTRTSVTTRIELRGGGGTVGSRTFIKRKNSFRPLKKKKTIGRRDRSIRTSEIKRTLVIRVSADGGAPNVPLSENN